MLIIYFPPIINVHVLFLGDSSPLPSALSLLKHAQATLALWWPQQLIQALHPFPVTSLLSCEWQMPSLEHVTPGELRNYEVFSPFVEESAVLKKMVRQQGGKEWALFACPAFWGLGFMGADVGPTCQHKAGAQQGEQRSPCFTFWGFQSSLWLSCQPPRAQEENEARAEAAWPGFLLDVSL